jgi:hypothetical protein
MNLLCPLNRQARPAPWAFVATRLVVCLATLSPEQVQAASDALFPDGIPQQDDHSPKRWKS